jgi:hypothetical protein
MCNGWSCEYARQLDTPRTDEVDFHAVQASFARTLERELTVMRRIAAHVPPLVWAKAKEEAGYGTPIKLMGPK